MSAITVEMRPDGVAVLTFDQPGSKANVLTRELWAEFGEALAGLSTRTDVKGLVLASAKPGIFIAGADLKLLANAPGPNDLEVRAFIERGLRVLEQLETLPFPTCAAIDGAALGGGLEVALACDYRVCGTSPKVQLGLPEVKLGLIPGWGGTQRLPRIVGYSAAADMLITGNTLPRDGAYHIGLTEVTTSEELLNWAASFIVRARSDRRLHMRPMNSPQARGESVPVQEVEGAAEEVLRVLLEGTLLPLYDGIKLETETFMRLAGSDESKRLIAEFFNRKK